MRCLEIGGGPSPAFPAYEQLDINDWAERGNPTTHQCDMRITALPAGAFDRIYAANVLEHVAETIPTLREWARILAPGGTLTVVVPDVRGILRDFEAGINSWPECAERLCGAQSYFQDVHRAAFTRGECAPYFEAAGLRVLDEQSSHAGGGVTVEATHAEAEQDHRADA